MGGYLPAAKAEQQAMLEAMGLSAIESLFEAIPDPVRLARPLDLPAGLSEQGVRRTMSALAAENTLFPMIFRGAGAYNHYIPAIAKQIAAKEEFVTAYTPYQAEISQGILQGIFEYQTMVCMLSGMDVANASVYDGASAAAEAVAMCRERRRERALLAGSAHPQTLETIQTYEGGAARPVAILPVAGGRLNMDALARELAPDVACVYVQSPNFYGLLEDVPAIAARAHAAGAKLIVSMHPLAAAMYESPGACGADIYAAEGQPLGLPLSFGGPYLGLMACKKELMRKLPGRIVGQTHDVRGQRAFVLTLQAREQHIRREKAASSLCTNQALCALTASAHLAAMGPTNLRAAAEACHAKAHYALTRIARIPGFERVHEGAFFCEFVTRTPVAAPRLLDALAARGMLGGLPVAEGILWCFTEMNDRAQIDQLVQALAEIAAGAQGGARP